MAVIVQQGNSNLPYVFDELTGDVTVDKNGYILDGSQQPILNRLSPSGIVNTPKTTTCGISELIARYQSQVLKAKFRNFNGAGFNLFDAITPIGTGLNGSYMFESEGWNIVFVAQGNANGKDLFTIQDLGSPAAAVRFSDMSFQDYTSTGLNSYFNNSATQLFLERLSIYGRNLSKNGLILAGGMVYVKDSLFDFINGNSIYIDDPTGGIMFIANCSFGNGGAQPSDAVWIYIANGLGGTYNITNCNMTGSGTNLTGLSLQGSITDLVVEGCTFDTPVPWNLNGTMTGCVIKNCPVSHPTAAIFGSNFYPAHTLIKDNPNFNPVGLLSAPFTTSVPSGGGAWLGVGAPSGTAAPLASTIYRVEVTDILINVSGGTGVDITIYDTQNTALASGMTTLTAYYIPAGYSIGFGAFTAAPTVAVWAI